MSGVLPLLSCVWGGGWSWWCFALCSSCGLTPVSDWPVLNRPDRSSSQEELMVHTWARWKLILSLSLSLCSLFLSLSLSLSLALSLSLSLSLTHIHTHMHALFFFLSLSLSHTHTLSLSLSLSQLGRA